MLRRKEADFDLTQEVGMQAQEGRLAALVAQKEGDFVLLLQKKQDLWREQTASMHEDMRDEHLRAMLSIELAHSKKLEVKDLAR